MTKRTRKIILRFIAIRNSPKPEDVSKRLALARELAGEEKITLGQAFDLLKAPPQE